jgi:hypothetical protein
MKTVVGIFDNAQDLRNTMKESAKTSSSGSEGVEFETAAILASASPLGINTMGAFPLSLIALGQIRRRQFDETLTLRPKRTVNANEELESSHEIELTALTEQIETTKPRARPYPPPTVRQGQSWLTVLATLIALGALFLSARRMHDINTSQPQRSNCGSLSQSAPRKEAQHFFHNLRQKWPL